ncbi:SusD/RagB family nutrient-binding outer membrane lipoprotein [Sphingobacterium sp. 2149]|uniref:SusD/RagB family nutrient-binding outer membrane lipoprotein n=1 Tax=Sphingobacterium sp. 2149 TaxID=2817763 RepID=UPI00285B559E|nr:SusD/RagB family nutrient-binding outer membrane lipoprotein [Sphingobacterium sp. 2149]MDR6737520.1 hypothetical protein [Sphingobacterium sp. 2149]
MKKINKILLFGSILLTLGSFQSCKTELEDRYTDPEQTTLPNIPAFFSQILNNSRLRSEYWHYRTFILMHQAKYTQTAYFANENTMYQQSDSYINDYWKDFYSPGIIGVYRSMERSYNNLSTEEKASRDLYMNTAKVILFDQASKLVDNFGDIPFSEAGSLPLTDVIKLGKFDDQKELYTLFINGLKEINTFLKTAKSTSEFNRADILNSGDLTKWRKYTNSLRLRLLMRISNVDENKAKTEIMDMLNNPTEYPLVDGDNNGDYSTGSQDILLQPLKTYNSSLLDALIELPSYYAPDYMLNTVLKTANDPRTAVLFDKFGETVNGKFVPNKEYQAMPITFTTAQADAQFRKYSVIDSATTWINNKLPGVLMTATETNLIKAEAQERWGTDAAAKTAYETAVKQSVSFYYYLNESSSNNAKATKPSSEVINKFVTESNIVFSGDKNAKLKLIGTQKWLHFGWLQGEQAWSEYRRTGYPILPAFPVSTLNGFQRPPVRLTYPSSEITNNSENYQAVRSKDTRDTKIFWDVN